MAALVVALVSEYLFSINQYDAWKVVLCSNIVILKTKQKFKHIIYSFIIGEQHKPCAYISQYQNTLCDLVFVRQTIFFSNPKVQFILLTR